MVYGIDHVISPHAVTIPRETLGALSCDQVNTTSNKRRSGDGPLQSELVGLTREERRRRRRATQKYRTAHATRERIRVEAFNVG